MLGDSILNHVECWSLKKGMKSTVSVRSIFVASTNDMAHHVKGFPEDISPDTLYFYIKGQTIWRVETHQRKIATNI